MSINNHREYLIARLHEHWAAGEPAPTHHIFHLTQYGVDVAELERQWRAEHEPTDALDAIESGRYDYPNYGDDSGDDSYFHNPHPSGDVYE